MIFSNPSNVLLTTLKRANLERSEILNEEYSDKPFNLLYSFLKSPALDRSPIYKLMLYDGLLVARTTPLR